MRQKECRGCKEVKPLSEFFRRTAAKDGYEYRCKDCVRTYLNTPHQKQYRRDYYLVYNAKKSGIVGEIPEPTGYCDICGQAIAGKNEHLDHNHVTKEFRGWLCMSCNTGLGMFKDNPDLMKKAIEYLVR
jgi:hypothetical protein